MDERVQIGDCTLYRADCRDVLPTLAGVDAVVTDPPYPTYLTEEYRFDPKTICILDSLECRQFVFWTPAARFPLTFGGVRVWDKAVGTKTQFELIYERNGASGYKVHRHYIINSTVAASFTYDIHTGHPSQKPIALIHRLVSEIDGNCVLDPFMGSGTTGVACLQTGRRFIGVELDRRYFDIACRRLEECNGDRGLFAEIAKPATLFAEAV